MSDFIETIPDDSILDQDASDGRTAGMALDGGYRFSRRIVALGGPDSAASETIRALQANLQATHIREGRRSLAICASHAGAGATYVAVNLAVALAQTGLNTLLIDADLHEPSMENYIRPDEPVSGLRQMLASEEMVNHVRQGVLPNLSVLYAGGTGPKSSELIANRKFKSVLDSCFRDYEMTIIDTSTAGGTADARRVAMNARYGLIVARRDVTSLAQIRTLAAEMTNDHVRLIGTFLSDF